MQHTDTGELRLETVRVVVTDDSEFRETIADLRNVSDLNIKANGLDAFFDCPLDFFEIKNGPTAGAGQCGVSIQRTQRLNDLLSALRACNVDFRHG
jgi:hypothetical protein